MTYKSVIWWTVGLVAVVSGMTTGHVDGDHLAAVAVVGFAYACGGTHGLYLGLTHSKRMQVYVDRRMAEFDQSVTTERCRETGEEVSS